MAPQTLTVSIAESMAVDENSSNSADTDIYTSEKSQSMSVADVDSGIEGMEVDEAENKIDLKRRRVRQQFRVFHFRPRGLMLGSL